MNYSGNSVITEITRLTRSLIGAWYYPRKAKMRKADFNEILNSSQATAGIAVCDVLTYLHETDKTLTLEEMMGEVHKMKMDLWNFYQKDNKNVKRCNDVTLTMKTEPDLAKLVNDPKLRARMEAMK